VRSARQPVTNDGLHGWPRMSTLDCSLYSPPVPTRTLTHWHRDLTPDTKTHEQFADCEFVPTSKASANLLRCKALRRANTAPPQKHVAPESFPQTLHTWPPVPMEEFLPVTKYQVQPVNRQPLTNTGAMVICRNGERFAVMHHHTRTGYKGRGRQARPRVLNSEAKASFVQPPKEHQFNEDPKPMYPYHPLGER